MASQTHVHLLLCDTISQDGKVKSAYLTVRVPGGRDLLPVRQDEIAVVSHSTIILFILTKMPR
jgi:hypothetical protein